MAEVFRQSGDEPRLSGEDASNAPQLGGIYTLLSEMQSPYSADVQHAREALKVWASEQFGAPSLALALQTVREPRAKFTLAQIFAQHGPALVADTKDRARAATGLLAIFHEEFPSSAPRAATAQFVAMRGNALIGAWQIDPERTVPHLFIALRDRMHSIRLLSVDILSESQSEDADEVVLQHLQKALNPTERHHIALVAAQRGISVGLPILLDNLKHDRPNTREKAYSMGRTMDILSKHGPAVLPDLIHMLSSDKQSDVSDREWMTQQRNALGIIFSILDKNRRLAGYKPYFPKYRLTTADLLTIKNVVVPFTTEARYGLNDLAVSCLGFLGDASTEVLDLISASIQTRYAQQGDFEQLGMALIRLGKPGEKRLETLLSSLSPYPGENGDRVWRFLRNFINR